MATFTSTWCVAIVIVIKTVSIVKISNSNDTSSRGDFNISNRCGVNLRVFMFNRKQTTESIFVDCHQVQKAFR